MKRLAGFVSAIAKFDGDNGGDDGSNVSVNPDTFVILASADDEKDRVGGWEAPVPLPRDDKIVCVPSTGISVLGELIRVLQRGWLVVESKELFFRPSGPFKSSWSGRRRSMSAGRTATRRGCGSSNLTELTRRWPRMAIIESSP